MNFDKKEMAVDILEHVIEETDGPIEFLEVLANIVIMYCESGKTDKNKVWAIETVIDIFCSYMGKKNLRFNNFDLVEKKITEKEGVWH
jgi:hypothetical protein